MPPELDDMPQLLAPGLKTPVQLDTPPLQAFLNYLSEDNRSWALDSNEIRSLARQEQAEAMFGRLSGQDQGYLERYFPELFELFAPINTSKRMTRAERMARQEVGLEGRGIFEVETGIIDPNAGRGEYARLTPEEQASAFVERTRADVAKWEMSGRDAGYGASLVERTEGAYTNLSDRARAIITVDNPDIANHYEAVAYPTEQNAMWREPAAAVLETQHQAFARVDEQARAARAAAMTPQENYRAVERLLTDVDIVTQQSKSSLNDVSNSRYVQDGYGSLFDSYKALTPTQKEILAMESPELARHLTQGPQANHLADISYIDKAVMHSLREGDVLGKRQMIRQNAGNPNFGVVESPGMQAYVAMGDIQQFGANPQTADFAAGRYKALTPEAKAELRRMYPEWADRMEAIAPSHPVAAPAAEVPAAQPAQSQPQSQQQGHPTGENAPAPAASPVETPPPPTNPPPVNQAPAPAPEAPAAQTTQSQPQSQLPTREPPVTSPAGEPSVATANQPQPAAIEPTAVKPPAAPAAPENHTPPPVMEAPARPSIDYSERAPAVTEHAQGVPHVSSRITTYGGGAMGVMAGTNRILTSNDTSEKVVGGLEVAGAIGGTALEAAGKVKGAGALGTVIAVADGGWETWKAGKEAYDRGASGGEIALTVADKGADVAITGAANFFTVGMAGNATHVLYERAKEQSREQAALQQDAYQMLTGQQRFDAVKLVNAEIEIQKKNAIATAEAVRQSTPGQLVENSYKIGVAINDTNLAAGQVAAANRMVDLTPAASANAGTVTIGKNFVGAQTDFLKQADTEELVRLGVKPDQHGNVSTRALSDAMVGPNGAAVSDKMRGYLVQQAAVTQKKYDETHGVVGSVGSFFKRTFTGDTSAEQAEAERDKYKNALKEMDAYKAAYAKAHPGAASNATSDPKAGEDSHKSQQELQAKQRADAEVKAAQHKAEQLKQEAEKRAKEAAEAKRIAEQKAQEAKAAAELAAKKAKEAAEAQRHIKEAKDREARALAEKKAQEAKAAADLAAKKAKEAAEARRKAEEARKEAERKAEEARRKAEEARKRAEEARKKAEAEARRREAERQAAIARQKQEQQRMMAVAQQHQNSMRGFQGAMGGPQVAQNANFNQVHAPNTGFNGGQGNRRV